MSEQNSSKMQNIGVDFEFVPIPAGSFTMGCSPGDCECANNEKPAHWVRVTKPFETAKYETTQAQWKVVMGSNPSRFKGGNRPVENVSWNDAQEFLRRMNERNDGYRYRLPTEVEWEYSARAWGTSPQYGSLDEIAWYDDNSGGETHEVGQKKPNAWGLYDMLGNVCEWVADWYDASYYGHSPVEDPTGPANGKYKGLRGGSWFNTACVARVSDRSYYFKPFDWGDYVGFRCVREE
jgi:formylglycine-generating enzyme required for sulfatase activity